MNDAEQIADEIINEKSRHIATLVKALTEIKENSYDDGAVYIAEEALKTK